MAQPSVSPYVGVGHHSALVDQFTPAFPGFPGSELDFEPHNSIRDELNVAEFSKRMGKPRPVHLANVHQYVDAFLGSYRDFEFYNAGCYAHADTRVFSQRPNIGYVPGPLESGVSPSTLLDFTHQPQFPLHTHGASLAYAYAHPDRY